MNDGIGRRQEIGTKSSRTHARGGVGKPRVTAKTRKLEGPRRWRVAAPRGGYEELHQEN